MHLRIKGNHLSVNLVISYILKESHSSFLRICCVIWTFNSESRPWKQRCNLRLEPKMMAKDNLCPVCTWSFLEVVGEGNRYFVDWAVGELETSALGLRAWWWPLACTAWLILARPVSWRNLFWTWPWRLHRTFCTHCCLELNFYQPSPKRDKALRSIQCRELKQKLIFLTRNFRKCPCNKKSFQ